MAELWFISDTHFSHTNIIKYANRPFSSAAEMDEMMVQRWNEVVKPPDHVYHLGDLCICRPKHIAHILTRLNGHKRLVRGNHDIFKTSEYWEFFEEIHGVRVLDNFIFTHIPIHPHSVGRFRANVHGHTHEYEVQKEEMGVQKKDNRYLNICVEHTHYRPISLEEIRQRVQ